MSGLELCGLRVRFGVGRKALCAVDGVDLHVPTGTVVGLVGESGSGKTTLAKAVVGLAPVSDGRILLDGQVLAPGRGRSVIRRRRSVQLVFQDPYSSLNPRMRVGESIAEAIRAADASSRSEQAAEVRRLLELVSLEPDHALLLPRRLSGGQRQRAALARALAARPSLLIADEMTSALDVSVQGTVLNLVRDIQRRLGLSMLFISHNLAVVRYMADVIAVMYCGQLVEIAPTEELTYQPRHPYTRELVASVPGLRSAGADAQALADAGSPLFEAEPADPHHPPDGCRFHPRCPIGPVRHAGRDMCRQADPMTAAADRPHKVACFFAEPSSHESR